MNIPSAIKGFSTPAPEFPYIEGLPLYPLTHALVNALKERFAIIGLTYPANNERPYGGLNEIMYDPQEGMGFSVSTLQSIDRLIGELSWYYFNQYLPYNYNVSYSQNRWTFQSLYEKAMELLDMPSEGSSVDSEGHPRTGSTYGNWGAIRAVMISLMTHIDISYIDGYHINLGTFQLTTMEGEGDDFSSSENSYNEAVENAKQKVQNVNRVFDFYHMWWHSFYEEYQTDIDMMTKFEFIPNSEFGHLLQGKLVYHGNATPWYNTYGFYNFGAPIVEGYNAIKVPSGSGVILSNTFPRPPQSFIQQDYQGWHIEDGHLVGDYSDYFQYGMEWGDSA